MIAASDASAVPQQLPAKEKKKDKN